MNKLMVIARNLNDYKEYLRTAPKPHHEYEYVYSSESLRGRIGVNFFITPLAFQRLDIREIIRTLFMVNIGTKYENKTRALNLTRLLYQ